MFFKWDVRFGPQTDAIPHDGATPVHLAYVVTPEGAKFYVAGRKMPATVHAVRLYASSLTEEQLQANLTTDRER